MDQSKHDQPLPRLLSGQRQLRFYLTAPSPCPYLPDRMERKVFTSLEGPAAAQLNDTLTHAGFRRSQNIAYRPACEGCDACISVRIPVAGFHFGRSWRRVLTRNADLVRTRAPPVATDDQYWLLRHYLDGRHADGGMAEMGMLDFGAMVEESRVRTHIVEYRIRRGERAGELMAAAIVDLMRDGLSLVYSFFDTDDARRSLGSFLILDAVRQAAQVGLSHVYLGYWVPGSPKMDYKRRYGPLEALHRGQWVPLDAIGEDELARAWGPRGAPAARSA
jgi:arginine-tRNA-protein transferase